MWHCCFILHTAKADELLQDTEIMSQTFERLVDRKDAIIRSLAKDLEEAEEQYPSHDNRLSVTGGVPIPVAVIKLISEECSVPCTVASHTLFGKHFQRQTFTQSYIYPTPCFQYSKAVRIIEILYVVGALPPALNLLIPSFPPLWWDSACELLLDGTLVFLCINYGFIIA